MAQDQLSPGRMEAFSDGVIAVIITIMVLEIHVPAPEISNAEAVRTILPLVLVYALSFLQTGIYWVNHHYLVDDLDQVTHSILWSNLAVLFCLSLVPAATAWVAVRHISPFSVALFCATLALPGLPWTILTSLICAHSGKRPASGMFQAGLSIALYVAAIPLAWVSPYISLGLVAVVAVIWLIPPRRIIEETRRSRE